MVSQVSLAVAALPAGSVVRSMAALPSGSVGGSVAAPRVGSVAAPPAGSVVAPLAGSVKTYPSAPYTTKGFSDIITIISPVFQPSLAPKELNKQHFNGKNIDKKLTLPLSHLFYSYYVFQKHLGRSLDTC